MGKTRSERIEELRIVCCRTTRGHTCRFDLVPDKLEPEPSTPADIRAEASTGADRYGLTVGEPLLVRETLTSDITGITYFRCLTSSGHMVELIPAQSLKLYLNRGN